MPPRPRTRRRRTSVIIAGCRRCRACTGRVCVGVGVAEWVVVAVKNRYTTPAGALRPRAWRSWPAEKPRTPCSSHDRQFDCWPSIRAAPSIESIETCRATFVRMRMLQASLDHHRPAQCDLRVGDATYMPRTLAAPSPTTAEREKRKEREEKREKKFGARVARAAAAGYLHREGQN